MSFIPPELVEAIVCEVNDFASLKACSLAGFAFRYSSQRILLRYLTLGDWARGPKTSCRAVSIFLQESPHIAAYITCLKIYLSIAATSSEERESLLNILRLLPNVRRCIVDGDSARYLWSDLTEQIVSVLLDFLARQPLRDLHVLALLRVPLPAFFHLLRAAPTIYFFDVSIAGDPGDLPALPPPHPSSMTRLGLAVRCQTICKLLARPQLAFYTAALRHLEVRLDNSYVHGRALICSSAHTLSRLHFNCRAASTVFPDDTLSYLPVLRYIEFRIELCAYTNPWFANVILAILVPNAAPALAELVVTFPVQIIESDLPPGISSNLLHALDAGLVAHPAAPSITWRLDLLDEDHHPDLTDFVASIRVCAMMGCRMWYEHGNFWFFTRLRIYRQSPVGEQFLVV
ncbi:hypothetical protein B0H19DRAFT_1130051 [Mycena capillaripes]|nr:hypothetical protein B0H19DRAFT_1130051 [Mycena capillaripes]